MSYDYWNKFVEAWRNLPYNEMGNQNPQPPFDYILGWQNPNLYPLKNSFNNGNGNDFDFSLKYIPEPWWGHDGNNQTELHAVVVNYNPGGGGNLQSRSNVNHLLGEPPKEYSQFVNHEVVNDNRLLLPTNNFHAKGRASKIFESLLETEPHIVGLDLNNFLSVELIPWHTPGVDNSVRQYIHANIKQVYEHSILFASDSAKNIANYSLQNKVIMRINGSFTCELLQELVNNRLINGFTILNTPVQDQIRTTHCRNRAIHFYSYPQNDNYRIGYMPFIIDHERCHNIIFISIWGTKTRNDFPDKELLEWFFKRILPNLKQP